MHQEAQDDFNKMQRLHPSVMTEDEMHKAFSPAAGDVPLWQKVELRFRYYSRVWNRKLHASVDK